MLAAAINALRVVGKTLDEAKVVVSGAGAAGTACAKMLATAGVKNLIGCDIHGVIDHERTEPGIMTAMALSSLPMTIGGAISKRKASRRVRSA